MNVREGKKITIISWQEEVELYEEPLNVEAYNVVLCERKRWQEDNG